MDTRWLRAQGIDAKSIHGYVARCWLQRLMRGVYRRPLPEGVRARDAVSWESAVLSLQRIMKYDVHLGGVSALDLAGLSHYLHLGGKPRIHLYGEIPTWLKRLPMDAQIVVHRRTLFGDDQTGIIDADRDPRTSSQVVNIWRWPLKASTPERAILEALDELTNHTGFRQIGQDLRRTDEPTTHTADRVAHRLPKREGAALVLCLRRSPSARLAEASGN